MEKKIFGNIKVTFQKLLIVNFEFLFERRGCQGHGWRLANQLVFSIFNFKRKVGSTFACVFDLKLDVSAVCREFVDVIDINIKKIIHLEQQ